MNLEALDPGILGPALLAGLLVLATHVPLGRQVLTRGIIFIDLAVAQIAGLGVIAAHGLDWDLSPWQAQALAFGAALVGAWLLYTTERRWAAIQEALIGSAFILAATGGVLLLAQNPHGGEHLKDLLAGQILWVSYRELGPIAVLYILILLAQFALRRHASSTSFYLLFALAVTASVQLVGVYLVFASLILPALATRRLPDGWALSVGYGLGAAGYALGLTLSALLDLPSGAVIVWLLAILSLPFALTGSKQASRA